MKLAVAVRADRVMAAPHDTQWFGAERARSRPLRAAFRAFRKQRRRTAEWLSQFLQIEDETARGVTANEEMFHERAPSGAHFGVAIETRQ